MTRKRWFQIIHFAVLVIGAVTLWHYAGREWQSRPPHWPAVNWTLALCSGVLAVAYSIAYGVGWHAITRVMGIVAPLWVGLSVWGYSILGKYTPGNVLLVSYRLSAYSLRLGARIQQVAGAIAIESAMSLLAGLTLLVALTAVVGGEVISQHVSAGRAALAASVLAAGAAVALLPPVKRLLLRLLRLESIIDSVQPLAILALLAYYVAAWSVITLSFWLLCRSMGIDGMGYGTASAIYVAAGLSGILAVFSPSGIGVREGVLVLLLSQSLPLEQALAVALAARINSLLGDLAAVGTGLVGLRILLAKDQAHDPGP